MTNIRKFTDEEIHPCRVKSRSDIHNFEVLKAISKTHTSIDIPSCLLDEEYVKIL